MRDWLGEAKAKQVYLVLRDSILSGAAGFGVRLPTEHALAETHGVSRVTVRRALGELARERLIERRRSAGTRVIYQPPAPMTADITGVLANLADMGRRTAVRLVAFIVKHLLFPYLAYFTAGDHGFKLRRTQAGAP